MAFVLLVVVVFLFNKDSIQRVLSNTQFHQVLEQTLDQDESDIVVHEEAPAQQEPAVEDSSEKVQADSVTIEIKTPIPEEDLPATSEQPVRQNSRRSTVYFISVDQQGRIKLKGIPRFVHYTNMPLKETIESLLKGLTPSEVNRGLLTMISSNTELLDISIKDGTAFMNFSENFQFNPLGIEGLKAQLKQVVFSATEFTNISDVQILIEGRRVDFLGPEGFYIGRPISRNSFVN